LLQDEIIATPVNAIAAAPPYPRNFLLEKALLSESDDNSVSSPDLIILGIRLKFKSD
jgi:hypothetical protein